MNIVGMILIVLSIPVAFSNCTEPTPGNKTQVSVKNSNVVAPQKPKDNVVSVANKIADPAAILGRKQVPVLCYHHIRDWKPSEKSSVRLYIVPVDHFREQIKSLADSGYTSITPDQYYAYLTAGAPLPAKPVMLTFDDTDEDQYTVAAAELNKYHFKGVFFIMTVAIGRPHYMTADQIRELSAQGHFIEAHTWDHHSMTQLKTEKDYQVQLIQPKEKLEAITGKKVDYFAYPFGIMDPKIFPVLQQAGYKCAYQLVQYKRDAAYPLYSIRRIIVPGEWNGPILQKWMDKDFRN